MRELKFRAKMRKKTYGHDGMWVYLNGIGHSHWCSRNGTYYGDIDPDTIGEYTGLSDKNVDFFEDDIVSGYIPDSNIDEKVNAGVIKFNEGSFDLYRDDEYLGSLAACVLNHTIKIIGNIHDNPELIEVIANERK